MLLAFVLLPLIEIALFIAIGGRIGVLATLALILLSALAGAAILRGQHARLAAVMQGALRVQPGTFLAQGAFRTMSGLLLILPGFLTDALGLVLLLPPLQRAIVRALAPRTTVVAGAAVWRGGEVVEGEFHETRGEPVDPARRIEDHAPTRH